MSDNRARTGSSLTRKASSVAVLGGDDLQAESEAVRGVLQAAAGRPMQDRLQAIRDIFMPTLSEAEDHAYTDAEMRDPTPRHGAFTHPHERWYQAEIAQLLRRVLGGADESTRMMLAMAFQAGALFKEMDLEGPGLRLDKAVVADEALATGGGDSNRRAAKEAADKYAPALAEAARLWAEGRPKDQARSARDMARHLVENCGFDLPVESLRKRLGKR